LPIVFCLLFSLHIFRYRLATLYYLQGKFKESIAMCELVLDVKPWHFGCLSGITLCYAELGDRVNVSFIELD